MKLMLEVNDLGDAEQAIKLLQLAFDLKPTVEVQAKELALEKLEEAAKEAAVVKPKRKRKAKVAAVKEDAAVEDPEPKPNGLDAVDRTAVKDRLIELIHTKENGTERAKQLLVEFRAPMFAQLKEEQLPLFAARVAEVLEEAG